MKKIILLLTATLLITACNKHTGTAGSSAKPTTYTQTDKLSGDLYAAYKGEWLPTQMQPAEYYLVYSSASWCPPCKMFNKTLMPILEKKNIQAILIGADKTPQAINKYAEGKPLFILEKNRQYLPKWAETIDKNAQTVPNLAIIKNNGELVTQNKMRESPEVILVQYLELLKKGK
jgi:thiol-disulfide isomerase/thioredoxin